MARKRTKLQNPQAILEAQQDSAALEALLPEAEKLVWAVLWRYIGPERLAGTPFEPQDLHQQGMIGFLQAVRRYNVGLGVPFSSYAVPLILGEMRHLLRSHGVVVKLPRTLADAHCRVQAARERFLAARGREPSVDELAEQTGLKADVVSTLLAMRATVSLDSTFRPREDDEEVSLMDQVAADDDWQEAVEARADLELVLSRLSERDRNIVRLRVRGLSQKQIGDQFGVSQSEISRRLAAIRRRMLHAS